jgi:hypothetical protein
VPLLNAWAMHLRPSRNAPIPSQIPHNRKGSNPPPLLVGTVSYGLAKEDRNGEEELQAGRDCRQAAAG